MARAMPCSMRAPCHAGEGEILKVGVKRHRFLGLEKVATLGQLWPKSAPFMVTKSSGSKRQNWSCLSSGKFVDFRRHRDTGTPPEVHGCDEVKLGDHLGHFPALICRSGDLATLWITLKTLSSYSSAFVALGALCFGLRYALACISDWCAHAT